MTLRPTRGAKNGPESVATTYHPKQYPPASTNTQEAVLSVSGAMVDTTEGPVVTLTREKPKITGK